MKKKPSEGYKQALKLLHSCCTPDGFLATITDSANYRRIWARDGVILSLAALAKRGKHEQAAKFLQGIHQANASESDGEAWSFPEFIHGKKLTPCGTLHQGWSAGAAIIGEHTLRGELLFRIEDHD